MQGSMESVIEQQRKLHEERERIEDAVVKEKTLKKATVSCISEHGTIRGVGI